MKAPAPGLGEHTEEVLKAAGVTEEEWAALKATGTVPEA